MKLNRLEKAIGYSFRNRKLLEKALNHRSYVNEHPASKIEDNERLEFLGDAVLNLIAGHMLMDRHPEVAEGELSRMRANLVNEARLAELARSIDLGEFIRLGKGELQTNGREKNSILADAFEAVTAAIYLDGGFQKAFRIISKHFKTFFHSIAADAAGQDYKSRLQELVQTTHKVTPTYKVIAENGPDHDKVFTVLVKVHRLTARGKGKSKKIAEQEAARRCLERLQDA